MSIRKWFCLEEKENPSSADVCFEKLLGVYFESLTKYFSVDDSLDIFEFLEKSKHKNLNPVDKSFLEWVQLKGIQRIKENSELDLPNTDSLLAMLEYDEFIIRNEIELSNMEEVRNNLITSINSIPEYISSSLEISASEEIDDNVFNVNDVDGIGFFNESSYFSEEAFVETINNSEPAITVGSFFMEEFTYGNTRILQPDQKFYATKKGLSKIA
ncbi:hypothetical protein [Bacillus mojavensis]|uniref:hypothetical protein n=1 Tax=Bacillus mojavensis TaxID=72360 RepID=UPI00227DA169|nr:hypothetical protein [Bacillus mojavensis]MCY8103437.1 hypothetical protein [Bacillus mojavensis]MCY8481396.1 hypothetical protein [Bacillus mojavensis]